MAASSSVQPLLAKNSARLQRKHRRSPAPSPPPLRRRRRRRRPSHDESSWGGRVKPSAVAAPWPPPSLLSLTLPERVVRRRTNFPAQGSGRRGRPTSPQRPPGNPSRKGKDRWDSPLRAPAEGWAESPGARGPSPGGFREDRWSSPERRGSQQRLPSPPGRRRPIGEGSSERMTKQRNLSSYHMGWGSPTREARQRSPRGWEHSQTNLPRNRGSQPYPQPLSRRHVEPGSPEGARSLESPSSHSRARSEPDWEHRQECPPGWNHPSRDAGGGRWSTSERRGGEQRHPPRRWQMGPGSPKRPLRKKASASHNPQGYSNLEQEQESHQKCLHDQRPPAEEYFWESPGGKWRSLESRGREHESPARVQRRRRQESMSGEERAWDSPKQREGWEGSGSLSSQSEFDSDQGGVSWCVSRQSSLGQRGTGAESPQSSDRQQRPTGSRPTFFSGGWNLGEGQAETESHGRGEQGSNFGREEGSPRRSPSPVEAAASTSAAQLLTWMPREQVVQYWMRCRATLKNRLREQLTAFCPRPTLPDRSSEVPILNPEILCLFSAKQVKEIESLSRPLRVLQNEVLDMLGPAMTIYEMAEEAMERGESVDPMELREWMHRLIRYIGSINHRLTLQRRIQVLGTLNPRLKMVSSKMASHCTEGQLFAQDKVKLLKEIIKRFPQLTVSQNRLSARRYQLAARRPATVAAWQRRFPQESCCSSKPRGKGLLAQAAPLDFTVRLFKPGEWVLLKSWKDSKLQPEWEGPPLVLLMTERKGVDPLHKGEGASGTTKERTVDPGDGPLKLKLRKTEHGRVG